MTITNKQNLAILLLVFVSACAQSNTRLGREKDGGEESITDASALEDADLASDGDSSAGSAASSGGNRPPETTGAVNGRDGNGGQGSDPGDASSPTDSDSSLPNVNWMEDPEVRQARLDLISEYCSLLERFTCLSSIYNDLVFDTMEERVRYCEKDLEYSHPVADSGCKSKWEEVLKCAIQYPYSCPCSGSDCTLAHPDYHSLDSPYPCSDSMAAWLSCIDSVHPSDQQFINITGERLSCTGLQDPPVGLVCQISCLDDYIPDDGDITSIEFSDIFSFECDGPMEGPLYCECTVNSKPLRDAYTFSPERDLERGIFSPPPNEFYSDCEAATQAMADGRCHDISDCCFTFFNDDGSEGCGCTADPTQSYTGATTCEELADALEGEVVDLCPQYKNIDATPPR